MSLLDAPLALIDRLIAGRSKAVRPDDPVARLVARTSGRLRPRSAYRHQLRGHVVNQYVAVREGLASPPPRRREMTVIGRAVLYASVALAVGVTSVGAASGSALPGDPLYLVKRQIEQVRIDIAPAWVRPSLIAMALDERLSEVESLARAGRWDRVGAAVADVEAAEAELVAAGGDVAGEGAALSRHESILAALILTAPDHARSGLERALAASTKASGNANGAANGHANGAGNANGNANRNGNANGNANGNGNLSPGPGASDHATPSHSPKPSGTPKVMPSTAASPAVPDSSPSASPANGQESQDEP